MWQSPFVFILIEPKDAVVTQSKAAYMDKTLKKTTLLIVVVVKLYYVRYICLM